MSPRTYQSELRAKQASETRTRVLAAAAAEFSRSGYAATSMPAIARRAGVSTETVKAQGAKHELLLAAFEQTFAGREGAEPIADDTAVQERLDSTPLARWPELFAAIATELNERGAGLWSAFRDAARADPAVAEVHRELMGRRLADHRRAVELFDARGLLARREPYDELAAALAHLSSPEGYELLVEDYGWSVERYRAWVADAVRRVLLRD